MNFNKQMYVMIHLVTPVLFFIIAFLWGHFYLSKPLWTNLTDNLSIMAIYYLGVSILWMLNMKSISKVSEEIESRKNEG